MMDDMNPTPNGDEVKEEETPTEAAPEVTETPSEGEAA